MVNKYNYDDKSLFDHLKDLFPICRSITGDGINLSLRYFEKYLDKKGDQKWYIIIIDTEFIRCRTLQFIYEYSGPIEISTWRTKSASAWTARKRRERTTGKKNGHWENRNRTKAIRIWANAFYDTKRKGRNDWKTSQVITLIVSL